HRHSGTHGASCPHGATRSLAASASVGSTVPWRLGRTRSMPAGTRAAGRSGSIPLDGPINIRYDTLGGYPTWAPVRIADDALPTVEAGVVPAMRARLWRPVTGLGGPCRASERRGASPCTRIRPMP